MLAVAEDGEDGEEHEGDAGDAAGLPRPEEQGDEEGDGHVERGNAIGGGGHVDGVSDDGAGEMGEIGEGELRSGDGEGEEDGEGEDEVPGEGFEDEGALLKAEVGPGDEADGHHDHGNLVDLIDEEGEEGAAADPASEEEAGMTEEGVDVVDVEVVAEGMVGSDPRNEADGEELGEDGGGESPEDDGEEHLGAFAIGGRDKPAHHERDEAEGEREDGSDHEKPRTDGGRRRGTNPQRYFRQRERLRPIPLSGEGETVVMTGVPGWHDGAIGGREGRTYTDAGCRVWTEPPR